MSSIVCPKVLTKTYRGGHKIRVGPIKKERVENIDVMRIKSRSYKKCFAKTYLLIQSRSLIDLV